MKIGLEIHVSLPTQSKLFCSCRVREADAEPNSNICPTCMGFPGAKPVLNKRALEVSVEVANALNAKLKKKVSFVRKVYFYPDLPKSYQITQLNEAVGSGGYLELSSGKKVGITRIQLEEDPAKIIREEGYTLIDFNRSGRPLVEIVTDPEITSEEELRDFISELRSILYYLGIDINEELKADLNVSVEGGVRVEVKNVTGIKALTDALKYELDRQNKIVKAGQEVKGETRSFDETKMITVSSREKETDEEYGYIYETDLTDYNISKLSKKQIVLPSKIANEYAKKYGINEKVIKELIMLSKESFELIGSEKGKSQMKDIIKSIEVLKRYNKLDISHSDFEKLIKVVSTGMLVNEETIKKIGKGEKIGGFKKIDDSEIDSSIRKIIEENSKLLNEYSKNKKVFNFIVGKISKEYKVDPRHVSERLDKVLDEITKKK